METLQTFVGEFDAFLRDDDPALYDELVQHASDVNVQLDLLRTKVKTAPPIEKVPDSHFHATLPDSLGCYNGPTRHPTEPPRVFRTSTGVSTGDAGTAPPGFGWLLPSLDINYPPLLSRCGECGSYLTSPNGPADSSSS